MKLAASFLTALFVLTFITDTGAQALSAELSFEAPSEQLLAQRKQFRAAYKALNNGQKTKSDQLTNGLELYPLYPFLRFEQLRRNLHRAKTGDIQKFLSANEDSALGEYLRTRWLRQLANRGHWKTFLAAYRPQSSEKLRCEQLLARVKTNALEGVIQDAIPLWLTGKSQHEQCDPAFAMLYKSSLMTDDLVWQRIGLTMNEGKPALANYLARRLPASAQQWVSLWVSVRSDPARGVLKKALASDDAIALKIMVYGLQRSAKRSVSQASDTWNQLKQERKFSAEQTGQVTRALALRAVIRKTDDQITLLDQVPAAAIDADVQRAQIRAAIRRQDWKALTKWTERPSAADMSDLRWRYWRARALEKTGDQTQSVTIYRKLAAERDYYGFRAADQLDVDYQMQNVPLAYTPAEMQAMQAMPGIARAAEFHAQNLLYEGRREWHFEIGRMEPRQMEVAARLAHHIGWHDRAIITLGRAGKFDDLEVRFPVAHSDLVIKYAKKRNIPYPLMLSIIRVESAFMEAVRSPAGALGLMQVMPATGRETAKAIGYRLKNTKDLQRAAPNITIGSAYLSKMLDRFSGNVAMAAAGYNAGPHRVHVWQSTTECQRAEDWIELIPFTETRRYVRKTLFYMAVYQWRMQEQITPLDVRMTAIPIRGKRSSCSV